MTKTYFHTYDIFDINDVVIRQKYFEFCYKKALNCGLTCRCFIEDSRTMIELWGTRYEFLKYYLETLIKCQYKLKAIKRLISFLRD